MVTIINYGSGNVSAISNIYKLLNIRHEIVTSPKEVSSESTHLILPGVGAFDETMKTLVSSGFIQLLEKLVFVNKLPILGICVGMQILSERSEEGKLKGLGWIKGEVRKFDFRGKENIYKIPHLGWNSIKSMQNSDLLEDIDLVKGFYFIHSYYFTCFSEENILTTTDYGFDFASCVVSKNIFGTQFHPEKSHKNGIQLLKNFANLYA